MDVLLVHAFPFDARFWADQVGRAPSDVRLHAFDLPGFGSAAGKPASTIDDLADAIQAASQGLRRFVLCGLSMGGYASFAWWKRYGGDGRVVGLVLADTKAEADTAEGKAGRDGTIKLAQEKGAGAIADQLLPRLLSNQAPAEVVARTRALIQSQTVEGIVGASRAMRDRPDSLSTLPTIHVPVLAIAAEHDQITPPSALETIARGVRSGKTITIAGAGHLSNLEQPGAFTDSLVSFARSVS